MSIKLSISGIRGLFNELTPNRVVKFAQAFASYIDGGSVAIGRDARPSGVFINEAMIAGFLSSGVKVFDYGIIPTPMLQWIIRRTPEFRGGISITAGHNTFDWNSLIFLNSDGAYLNRLEGDEYFNLHHAGYVEKKSFDSLGVYERTRRGIDEYYRELALDITPKHKLKFVADCSNGFDAELMNRLAEVLKVEIIPIFCREDRVMQKDPEPNPANAAFLETLVRATGSDGGFMLNSDASRVLVVNEKGEALSEELTLPVFARIMLDKGSGPVVTNYSTSKMVDSVAERYKTRVYRTDVGQPYVVQMVRDIKARIGGEGNGSVIFSPFSPGFDAFYFIREIVDYLYRHNTSISSIASEFKPPLIYKETIYLPPNKIYTVLEKIGKLFTEKEKMDLKDGYYIDKGSEWLCVRVSATVSMIRIIGEGRHIPEKIARIKELVL